MTVFLFFSDLALHRAFLRARHEYRSRGIAFTVLLIPSPLSPSSASTRGGQGEAALRCAHQRFNGKRSKKTKATAFSDLLMEQRCSPLEEELTRVAGTYQRTQIR
jgi:hypothetical protein